MLLPIRSATLARNTAPPGTLDDALCSIRKTAHALQRWPPNWMRQSVVVVHYVRSARGDGKVAGCIQHTKGIETRRRCICRPCSADADESYMSIEQRSRKASCAG